MQHGRAPQRRAHGRYKERRSEIAPRSVKGLAKMRQRIDVHLQRSFRGQHRIEIGAHFFAVFDIHALPNKQGRRQFGPHLTV